MTYFKLNFLLMKMLSFFLAGELGGGDNQGFVHLPFML